MKARSICAVAVLLWSTFAAAPALALDVVACLGTSLAITDDPRNCAPGQRIDAMSVAVDFKNPTTLSGGGMSTGRTVPSDLKIAKRMDATSTYLFMNTARGTLFPRLLVAGFENDRGVVRRVFSILLSDVLVSQFEISASDTQRTGAPTELVAFRYGAFLLRDDVTGQMSGFDFRTQN